MIRMRLSDAALVIGAHRSGDDAWFEGVSTDTRTATSGELFCALSGPKFDGHEHCAEAGRKGVAGAIVERAIDAQMATLMVDNSRRALGNLAGAWRRQFTIPVIGVTGSNGKTTVKEMLAAILRVKASVLATAGNLNNDIGVPHTLFQMGAGHEYAVVEMGANHLGEIERLAEIAQPLIGVVTLCAPAHLEGFGSIDRVAEAKGELYAGLVAHGTAVINADDSYADYWCDIAKDRRILRFGIKKPADIVAANITNCGIGSGMSFELRLPSSRIDIELPFDGIHNVANALAAAAAAVALEMDPATIKSGLESARKVGGRLCVLEGVHGCRIIDDTYNANPTSLDAAVEVLASASGEKWLVLGDMAELGPDAADIHHRVGLTVRSAGIDRLYTFGELAAKAGASFGEGAHSYRDPDALIEALGSAVDADVTILVKGSRAMRMERVIGALVGVTQVC